MPVKIARLSCENCYHLKSSDRYCLKEGWEHSPLNALGVNFFQVEIKYFGIRRVYSEFFSFGTLPVLCEDHFRYLILIAVSLSLKQTDFLFDKICDSTFV